MADHDPEARIAVEHAAGDEPEQMQPDLDAEAEDRAVEPGLDHRADHRIGRRLGMDVEQLPSLDAGAQDRIELGIVEILALRVAVDHHALEAELLAAGDLVRAPLRILRRDRGHADETARMARHRLGEPVVGANHHRFGLVGFEDLNARRGQRQDRDVDAGRVHVGDAAVAEIEQPLDHLDGALRRAGRVETPERGRAPVRLPVADQPQIAVDLLAGRECLLGRDAQIAAVAAGLELVGHSLPPRHPSEGWGPCRTRRPSRRPHGCQPSLA